MSVPGRMPHIFGGMRRGARHARVDDDEVRAVELRAFEQMLQRHRMRLGRIAAHDDLRLGVADVVEAVGHRAVAPGVGYAGDRGRMADARLVVGVVGAPEGAELAEQIGALVGELRRARASTPDPAPDFSRIASSLSPISLIALVPGRCGSTAPSTSFIG